MGGGVYWKELLERIRDIRASEKVMYRQVLDLYATSMDYDPAMPETLEFFKPPACNPAYRPPCHTSHTSPHVAPFALLFGIFPFGISRRRRALDQKAYSPPLPIFLPLRLHNPDPPASLYHTFLFHPISQARLMFCSSCQSPLHLVSRAARLRAPPPLISSCSAPVHRRLASLSPFQNPKSLVSISAH